MRPRAKGLGAAIAALALLTMARPARSDEAAAPLTAEAKAEAGDRFDRALRLFAENDNAAALAEFQRVYQLVPNPVVLYNIGLVDAALNRPVEAVATFDKLLAAPGSLSAERLARARVVRDEQSKRIANVQVTVNVDGAAIEVDGVAVAKFPLESPLRVASGTHVVGAVADGHAPVRKEITIAGGMSEAVALTLLPMAGRLAHLAIRTHLPGASVLVDGAAAGRTPLAASLTLPPGAHDVAIARPGYTTLRREIVLGDGASGEITFEPDEDRAALETEGGTLALAISQPQALVTVDGRQRGVYTGSLRLARGMHRIRIDRGGFLPYERDVEIARGVVTTVPIELYPGPDTLAALTANARAHRTWGWVSASVSAALVGGGVAVLLVDGSQRTRAKADFDTLESAYAHDQSPCKLTEPRDHCNGLITAAHDRYTSAQSRDALGWALGGAGVAAAAVAVYLLVTGEDPHRYDKKPGGDLFAKLPAPSFVSLRGGGGVALGATF